MDDIIGAAMAHANSCAANGDLDGASRWLQIFMLREMASRITAGDFTASAYINSLSQENRRLQHEIRSLRHQLNSKTRAEYEARESK